MIELRFIQNKYLNAALSNSCILIGSGTSNLDGNVASDVFKWCICLWCAAWPVESSARLLLPQRSVTSVLMAKQCSSSWQILSCVLARADKIVPTTEPMRVTWNLLCCQLEAYSIHTVQQSIVSQASVFCLTLLDSSVHECRQHNNWVSNWQLNWSENIEFWLKLSTR